ncbi:MAG: co-chaperone GroES [Rickettsiales bacterium]|nr:co-chaperone GroES [Rickettsiales bacterium]
MAIRPLHDRILVERLEQEQKTAGGIIIPDNAKEKPTKGKVVAVGNGTWDEDGEKRIPLDVKKGDVVLFAKWGGTEVSHDGKEYLIMKESDILAILEDKKAA